MKILICGDPHFKDRNLSAMTAVWEEILQEIETRKIDKFVCLGDTLHDHKTMSSVSRTIAVKFFLRIADRCQITILIGNHDRPSNSDFLSDFHPFVGLSHPNLTIASKVVVDENNFVYVPYVPIGRFSEALDTIDSIGFKESFSKYPLIFAHQEFHGLVYNGITSNGDKWSPEYPPIYTGHIHTYQKLPNGVTCVGALMQENYGDDTDKALIELELSDDLKILREERVYLRTIPKLLTFVVEDLSRWEEVIPNKKDGEKFRVVLKIPKISMVGIDKNPQFLELRKFVDKLQLIDISSNESTRTLMKRITVNEKLPTFESLVEDLLMKDSTEDSSVRKSVV